jgi:hypothetical protein
MKVINAYWEKFNTGLNTCEIIFEKEDGFQNYLDSNPEKDYEFLVIKIPVGNLDLVHKLEDIGYRYLENQILLIFEINQIENIDLKWQRILNGFTCVQIRSRDELDTIIVEVNKQMFKTDRYYLDPFWEQDLSSIRYRNWILDLFTSGHTKFYKIIKNGVEIGFFSAKAETKRVNICQIAGIYNNFKSSGYIFVLTWFWLVQSRKEGFTKLITTISSNNRIMLSSLSKVFSFSIREVYIVLRKHK